MARKNFQIGIVLIVIAGITSAYYFNWFGFSSFVNQNTKPPGSYYVYTLTSNVNKAFALSPYIFSFVASRQEVRSFSLVQPFSTVMVGNANVYTRFVISNAISQTFDSAQAGITDGSSAINTIQFSYDKSKLPAVVRMTASLYSSSVAIIPFTSNGPFTVTDSVSCSYNMNSDGSLVLVGGSDAKCGVA
jgi:hypothetical protein